MKRYAFRGERSHITIRPHSGKHALAARERGVSLAHGRRHDWTVRPVDAFGAFMSTSEKDPDRPDAAFRPHPMEYRPSGE